LLSRFAFYLTSCILVSLSPRLIIRPGNLDFGTEMKDFLFPYTDKPTVFRDSFRDARGYKRIDRTRIYAFIVRFCSLYLCDIEVIDKSAIEINDKR